MLRPRIVMAVASAVISAALIVVLVIVAEQAHTAELLPFPIALFASPVVLLLVGAFFLMRGSRIARALLGALFAISVLSFAGIVALLLLVEDVPWEAVATPTLWSSYLVFPAWLLLFSRKLGEELAQIRK